MEKEINISVPEGYEIDEKNSTFKCIKFKPIEQKFVYVNLGLPSGTLWATCNVGAKNESDFGDYLTLEEACKYNLPKHWQFRELIEECDWKWNSELQGYTILGLNRNSIFLPAAGFRYCSLSSIGSVGNYWSCTLSSNESDCAWYLYFSSIGAGVYGSNIHNGRSIRPVFNTKILK